MPEESMLKADIRIVDFEQVEKEFNKEDAAIIFGMMLNSFPEELAALDASYQKNDWESIRKLVHKIKGSASYCAAMRLKEACVKIEESVESNSVEVLKELYKHLLEEVALVEKAIKEKLFH
jgi:HPt (histidine-containing phosphotransfer) domain-containing protein